MSHTAKFARFTKYELFEWSLGHNFDSILKQISALSATCSHDTVTSCVGLAWMFLCSVQLAWFTLWEDSSEKLSAWSWKLFTIEGTYNLRKSKEIFGRNLTIWFWKFIQLYLQSRSNPHGCSRGIDSYLTAWYSNVWNIQIVFITNSELPIWHLEQSKNQIVWKSPVWNL